VTAVWSCALVAVLSAACWSLVTPPFQAPDEPSHFAYVKQLAETGGLPTSSSNRLSPEEQLVLSGVHDDQVRQQPQDHTIASELEQRELGLYLRHAAALGTIGSPAAGVAALQPPLYYALESLPYHAAEGASELARLQWMRLLSALFAGLTAAFVFLFVRETLPGVPWSWTVAGLAVALAPLLGFMSGSVNPDSLLYAVSAATFYVLARAFRRGLTWRTAAALGVAIALGLLTKVNYVGLAPGAMLGLAVLSVRAARGRGRSAYLLLALGAAIALSPVAAYALHNLQSGKPALGVLTLGLDLTHGSLLSEAGYVWQLYLPRLPGMTVDFPGLFTTRQLWFDGYVGLYGWLDTPFPAWVDTLALIPAAAILALCGRSLVRGRALLASRASELVVYAAMALGLLVLIGADSYLAFPRTDAEYAQVRYLLPLLPLLGLVLALAARGAGRRWGPVVGALIVVLFAGHDLFSQLQVVARYYG
jgi:4-amino-4-deoxy-L-arabinose transferase-like glycosyltransferase